MRARKRKNTPERILACGKIFIDTPEAHKETWNEVFENNNKCHLEIGCGKGDFVLGMAEKNPDINFIAVEKVKDIIVLALEKFSASELTNARFICCNAENLNEYFNPGFFDRIYINFCDPWPKARHAKRRLTSPENLKYIKSLLSKNGEIHFKTDNIDLFNYSLETFVEAGYKLKNVTFDLHNSEFNEENVTTEYERNFSQKGFKINRLEASPIWEE